MQLKTWPPAVAKSAWFQPPAWCPNSVNGTLRALAVTAPARLAAPFDLTPAWFEQGVDCVLGVWRGVDGARGLNSAQIAFWDATLAAATASATWKSAITQHHWSELYRGSAELRAYLPRERAQMSATLSELGLLK